MKVNNKDGAIINVASQANALDSLSQAEIKQMLDSNNLRDGGTITIHKVSDGMNPCILNNNIRNISTFNNVSTNLFSGYKYKTSKVLSSEYAANNTREFRVQFYAKKVSFTQYKLNSSNNQVIATKSGKAAVPTRFALYSIDRKLK